MNCQIFGIRRWSKRHNTYDIAYKHIDWCFNLQMCNSVNHAFIREQDKKSLEQNTDQKG